MDRLRILYIRLSTTPKMRKTITQLYGNLWLKEAQHIELLSHTYALSDRAQANLEYLTDEILPFVGIPRNLVYQTN